MTKLTVEKLRLIINNADVYKLLKTNIAQYIAENKKQIKQLQTKSIIDADEIASCDINFIDDDLNLLMLIKKCLDFDFTHFIKDITDIVNNCDDLVMIKQIVIEKCATYQYDKDFKELVKSIQSKKAESHRLLSALQRLYKLVFTYEFMYCRYTPNEKHEFAMNLLYYVSKYNENLANILRSLYDTYTNRAVMLAVLQHSIDCITKLISAENTTINSH